MKKKIAALLGIVTLLSSINSVFAYEHTVAFFENFIKYDCDGTAVESCIQSDVVHGGNRALMVKNTNGGYVYTINLEIPSGSTISFWQKGYNATSAEGIGLPGFTGKNTQVPGPAYVSNDGTTTATVTIDYMKGQGMSLAYGAYYDSQVEQGLGTFYPENIPTRIVERREDGWIRWETNSWFIKESLSYLQFWADKTTTCDGLYYIDDIVIKNADGSIHNVVDFEEVAADELIGLGNSPAGLLVNYDSTTKQNVLSWRNPQKTIDKIEVSRNDTVVEGLSISTASEALNVVNITPEASGETTYKVTLTIDGVEYSKSIKSHTSGWINNYLEGEEIPDWKIFRVATPEMSLNYDYDNKVDGKRSMRIDINTTSTGDKVILKTADTFEPGQYALTYRVKSAIKGAYRHEMWRTIRKVITLNEAQVIDLIVTGGDTVAAWIDDVRLYAYGEDGNVIEENLLKNGSFDKDPVILPNEYSWSFTEYYGDEVNNITQDYGESYFANLKVTNNKTKEGLNVYLISVVRKNGKISSIQCSENATSIAKGETKEASLTIEVDSWDYFDTDANEYEVSVFAWNGLDTMVPLTTPATLTE